MRPRCCRSIVGLAAAVLVATVPGCWGDDAGSGDDGSGDGGPSGGCQSADDCADGNACDPRTRTCVAACNGGNEFSCEGEALCISQDQEAHGACYAMCELFTNEGCASNETCRRSNDLYSFGMCMPAGTAALGTTCSASAVSTGCVKGALCVQWEADGTPTCTAMCNPWGEAICGAGMYCDPINLGICVRADNPYLQDVAIDAACAANRNGYPCGEGKGLCEEEDDGTVVCHTACRTLREDCPTGQDCHPWNTSAPETEADLPGSCY